MTDACERYAKDPEGNAAHLAVCERCRAIDTVLGTAVDSHPLHLETLPLAPWEGASYRAWPLIIGGALLVLALAFALCNAAGISPVRAVAAGMSAAQMQAYIALAADAVRRASLIWQIAFGFAFIAVNTALVLLLRRAPRGIDA